MGERIPAFYEHKNIGNHMVVGLGTKPPFKYGYFGGGRPVPNGVYPADVRARPDLFSCGNCRGQFTVTPTEVFCPNCSKSQVAAFKAGRPIVNREKVVEPVQETPPPPEIELLPELVPEPEIIPAVIMLSKIDFGGKRHAYYLRLLETSGITTAYQAEELGEKGLMAIPGIGEKTAAAILEGKIRSD